MESNNLDPNDQEYREKKSRGPMLHQWFPVGGPHHRCTEAVGKVFESKEEKDVLVKVDAVYPSLEYWREEVRDSIPRVDFPSLYAIPAFVITPVTGKYIGKTFIMGAVNFFNRFDLHTVEM